MDELKIIIERIEKIEETLKNQSEEIELLKARTPNYNYIQNNQTQKPVQNVPKVEPSKPQPSIQQIQNTSHTVIPKKAKPDSGNLELKIGGVWINRIGILAIIFGLAYFLKYAFDNNLIGPAGRVMIGIVCGLTLIFFGDYFHKKYSAFAQGLTGGGIAFLYFSVFAAFSFYNFIDQSVAFTLLALITAAASVFSLRYNAWSILLLGIITGFLTPFLLNSENPSDLGFLTYIIILDLGILSVAFFRKWRFINYVSYAATQIVFLIWLAGRFKLYDPNISSEVVIQFWTAEIFATSFFIIFLAISLIYNILKQSAISKFDYLLLVLNAAVYFFTNYYIISGKYKWFLGLYAVIMALVYFLIPYFIGIHFKLQKTVNAIFLGIALTFITLAIPIQLDGNWITLAWAAEGLVLLYTSFAAKQSKIRLASLIILALTVFRLLALDLDQIATAGFKAAQDKKVFIPVFNTNSLIFIVCIFALFIGAGLYNRNKILINIKLEKHLVAIISIGANILAILFLIVNTSAYFSYLSTSKGIGNDLVSDLYNMRQFIYSAILILYSLITIVTGIFKKIRYIRIFSFILFLISIIKVFLFDLSILEKGYRIMSFVLLGLILIGVSYLYQRFKSIIVGVNENEVKS